MNSVTALEKKHFQLFIKHFSPSQALYERWTYFCSKNKASYWGEIQPMKFWEISSKQFKTTDLSGLSMNDWTNVPRIDQSSKKIKEVVMVACGNAEPEVKTFDAHQFFSLGYLDLPIDYVVSLIAGHLVLVTNHGGETMLLSR